MPAPLTVLLGDRLVASLGPRLAADLGDRFRVVVPEGPEAFTPDGLVPFAAQADIIVATGLRAPTIAAARRCRLVQCWIAGVDRFDLEALAAARLVLSAAHGNAVAVAEHALGLVLALGRHIVRGDRALRRGDWSVGFAAGAPPHAGISGRTVTIVGYGSIGQAFGRLASGFGFRLIGVRRHPERSGGPAAPATIVGLDRLDWALGEADVVVLALPKTRETVGLIDARRLAAMQRDAWLVQVGRSETVDEAALFEACRDRRIAGAGIDVWWSYPPPYPMAPARLPFHELDNVVMTPHSSGWTLEGREAQMAFVVENLRRFARGEPVEGVVDLELGY